MAQGRLLKEILQRTDIVSVPDMDPEEGSWELLGHLSTRRLRLPPKPGRWSPGSPGHRPSSYGSQSTSFPDKAHLS